MDLNINVNECPNTLPPPAPEEGGPWTIRAQYLDQPDGAHLYGPFPSRHSVDACAIALAGRIGVRSVSILVSV